MGDLDFVDEDDIICHNINLLGAKNVEKMLNIFQFDADWDEHQRDYEEIKNEILGADSDDDDDDSDDDSDSANSDGDSDDASVSDSDSDSEQGENENDAEIADLTNANVMNLRRRIYLTIVSSLSAEEMAHKIMKTLDKAEKQVSHMILEACSHERSYRKQYGLLAERLSKLKSEYEDCFDELFVRQYENAHLLDTNKIRNVAKFFAHLLHSNALDWSVMEFIKLNERDTNPSKRIFIKILFQELASFMGKKLKKQLFEENYGKAFDGLFPMKADSNPKDIRFCINFFTTIGLGGLTEEMRAFLKQKQQELIKMQQAQVSSSDDDDSSSSSDSEAESSSDASSSDTDGSSEDDMRRRKQKRKRNSSVEKKRELKEKRRSRKRRSKSKSSSRSISRSRSRKRSSRRSRDESKGRWRPESRARSMSRGRWGN